MIFNPIKLSRGSHETAEEGVCFMEAIAFIAGEPHSDHPKCASPVLTSFGIMLNDTLPADLRNKYLLPMVGQVAGTVDPESEGKRREFLFSWLNETLRITYKHKSVLSNYYFFFKVIIENSKNPEDFCKEAIDIMQQAILMGKHEGFLSDVPRRVKELVAIN